MKTIVMLFFFLQPLLCLSQSKMQKQPPPPPSFTSTKKDQTINKYSLKERKRFYPFNQASQIKLVFFERRQKIVTLGLKGGPNKEMIDYEYGLPIINDTICFSQLAQTIALPLYEIDSLTDLLYNTCYRSPLTLTSKAGCYLPHNAILFFDKNDQPFEYIELCFSCRQIKYSSPKMIAFDDCDDAFQTLKAYFTDMGIAVTGKEMNKNN